MLTPHEKRIIDSISDIWNDFVNLPSYKYDDVTDFRQSLHNLQRIVMSRSTRREHPELFVQDP